MTNILVWVIIIWLAGIAAGLLIEISLIWPGIGFGLAVALALWTARRKVDLLSGSGGQPADTGAGLGQGANAWAKVRLGEAGPAGLIFLLVASLLAGMFYSTAFKLSENPLLPRWPGEQIELVGQVVTPVKSYPNRDVLLVRATGFKVPGPDGEKWFPLDELTEVIQYRETTWASLPGSSGIYKESSLAGSSPSVQFTYGDQIRLSGSIRVPAGARNPGDFDYRRHLANQRIYSQVVLTGDPLLMETGSPVNFVFLAAKYKEKSIKLIKEKLPGREGNLLAAMTFGWREGLTDVDKDLYVRGGLYHLFAVSGLHMGFLLLAGFWLTGRLKVNKYLSFILVTLLVGFYAAMADFSVSAVRAAIMGVIGMSAFLWQRQKDFYTALALAAFILTLVNPYYLFQVGFQLSFLATWGIVFFYRPLEKLVTNPLGKKVSPAVTYLPVAWWKKLLIVPVAAQLALVPLLAYYFNVVSLLGLVTNALSLWLVAVVVLTGLVILPVNLVLSPLGEVVLITVGGGIYFLTKLLAILSELPGAYFRLTSPSLAAIGLYYLTVVYLAAWYSGNLTDLARPWLRWHYPKVSKLVAIILIVFLVVAWANPQAPGQLTIAVLDVGQGDAIVVSLPNGKNLLIDGGGIPSRPGTATFNPGEKVVLPYIQRQGIKKMDLVVNTHGHYDHVAGLIPVLQNLIVEQVLLSPLPANSETYFVFLDLIEHKNIPVIIAKRGQVIRLDPEVELIVLHPEEIITGVSSELNENSLVLKLVYKQFAMLFTGDIEQAAMAELVAKVPDLTSVVYKVAHHGSTSGLVPEFLDRVNPLVAVIPVGKNSFGHPDEQLLQYLAGQGAAVYRTDLDGGIIISTDGNSVRIDAGR